ncbi:hypothetical protein ZWY2020_018147 [Hordeum vulgare]|nr:hypothetical protein ZWY2020_018147 [Hordeum vulgare]
MRRQRRSALAAMVGRTASAMATSVRGGEGCKGMDTSSESCKLQDEQYQYYKNLDDEKKYFLVLMLGDFQDAMIIPEEVVWRLKGEIPGEIKLETRNGYSHTILVAKNQGKLVLTVGWRQFVENYDLQMDDSFIFRYKGNSQFSAMIFDELGREKALSVVPSPFCPQVQDRRNEAHEIGPINFYFLVCSVAIYIIVPKEFLQRFKGEFPREMILETQNRRSYKIGVAKNNGKLVFTVGWGKFVETLGLKRADTIVFRYNGNSQFNVIIFDEDGCEKASSVFLDPSPPPVQERRTSATDTVKSSHVHTPMGESSSEEEYVVRKVPRSDYVRKTKARQLKDANGVTTLSSLKQEHLKDHYITAHKTKLTATQKEVVK